MFKCWINLKIFIRITPMNLRKPSLVIRDHRDITPRTLINREISMTKRKRIMIRSPDYMNWKIYQIYKLYMVSLKVKWPNTFNKLSGSEYIKQCFEFWNYHCGKLMCPKNYLAVRTAVKSQIIKCPQRYDKNYDITDVSHHVRVTSPTYVDYEYNAPECFLHTLLYSLSIHWGSIITIQVPGCTTPI